MGTPCTGPGHPLRAQATPVPPGPKTDWPREIVGDLNMAPSPGDTYSLYQSSPKLPRPQQNGSYHGSLEFKQLNHIKQWYGWPQILGYKVLQPPVGCDSLLTEVSRVWPPAARRSRVCEALRRAPSGPVAGGPVAQWHIDLLYGSTPKDSMGLPSDG